MALEITRALQGDEVVSKTDAESSYAKLNQSNEFTGTQKILNDGSVILGWNNNDIKLEISASGTKNPQVKTPQGYLYFKNKTVHDELPESYSESTSPTKNTQLTTKKYVDDKVSGVAKLSGNNTFTNINTFTSAINVNGNLGIYFNDNSGNNSLRIFSDATRSGKTNFATFGTDDTYDLYCLRKGGPREDNDITNKKYVDDNFVTKSSIGNDYQAKLKRYRMTLNNLYNGQTPNKYNSAGDRFETLVDVRNWGISGLTSQTQIVNIVLERKNYTEEWNRGITLNWAFDYSSTTGVILTLVRPRQADLNDWNSFFKGEIYANIIWSTKSL